MIILSALPVIVRSSEEIEKTSEAVDEIIKIQENTGLPTWSIVLIVVLCILLFAAIISLTLLAVRQKNQKSEPVVIPASQMKREKPRSEEKVVIDSHSHNTQRLWSNNSPVSKEQVCVQIRDISSPDHYFKVALDGGVIIGREIGDVVISYDRFISSQHCKLTYNSGILYVQDLGSANGTFYDGQKIQRKTAVINGGIIKVGETELKLETIKEKC